MKSPLICLLPVLAFALYPLERAGAIAISESSATFVESSVFANGGVADWTSYESGLPVAFAVSPVDGELTLAASSWHLVNAPSQAVWTGAQILLAGPESFAQANSQFWFNLGEPVNYSVTSNFLADLETGAQAFSAVRLEKLAGVDFQWMDLYKERDDAPSLLALGDGSGVIMGAASGFLEPGKYIFSYVTALGGGEGGIGAGNFSFTMTRNVPDAGSTILLLGLALGALGGIFRKVNLA